MSLRVSRDKRLEGTSAHNESSTWGMRLLGFPQCDAAVGTSVLLDFPGVHIGADSGFLPHGAFPAWMATRRKGAGDLWHGPGNEERRPRRDTHKRRLHTKDIGDDPNKSAGLARLLLSARPREGTPTNKGHIEYSGPCQFPKTASHDKSAQHTEYGVNPRVSCSCVEVPPRVIEKIHIPFFCSTAVASNEEP